MTKEDYMRLPKSRLAELLELRDKSLESKVNSPAIMVTPYTPPCYAPDGICTNPYMDCVNCPKRGATGGIITTTGTGPRQE